MGKKRSPASAASCTANRSKSLTPAGVLGFLLLAIAVHQILRSSSWKSDSYVWIRARGGSCEAEACVREVSCRGNAEEQHYGCHGGPAASTCKRFAIRSFIDPDTVHALRVIAEKGMRGRTEAGGPCILDINAGMLRDGDGIAKIYEGGGELFTKDEYSLYRNVAERIRSKVQGLFGLDSLYFTAPTFITRLIGNETWKPASAHDEYFHTHVDQRNTPHYHYSALLYLADYEADFRGGLFSFEPAQEGEETTVVEPSRGLLLAFRAGSENPHRVHLVTEGRRYVLSFWFTCDAQRTFKTFLDGKTHERFGQ